jgi:hypothetical protein
MRRNNFKTRKFENLEDRRMMAGDISFDNGIVTITGDSLDDQAEVRVIRENDGDIKLKVDLFAADPDFDPSDDDADEAVDHSEAVSRPLPMVA